MKLLGRSILVGLFSLGLAALVFARGAVERPAPAVESPPQPPRHTAAPHRVERGALGLVLPQEAADVSALAAGKVIAVPVRLGDRVRAGDLLASLDASLPAASLDAAEAALAAERARYEVAVAESQGASAREKRIAALGSQSLLSREEQENA